MTAEDFYDDDSVFKYLKKLKERALEEIKKKGVVYESVNSDTTFIFAPPSEN